MIINAYDLVDSYIKLCEANKKVNGVKGKVNIPLSIEHLVSLQAILHLDFGGGVIVAKMLTRYKALLVPASVDVSVQSQSLQLVQLGKADCKTIVAKVMSVVASKDLIKDGDVKFTSGNYSEAITLYEGAKDVLKDYKELDTSEISGKMALCSKELTSKA
jgi:hypothetical protein